MTESKLTIGALARAAGVSVETVRFYQRKDLLREPPRTYGGTRRYSEADVARLRFIKAAQGLGFSLKEIDELLELERGGSCQDVQALAAEKQRTIRERIADLQRLDDVLTGLLKECEQSKDTLECPIIATLAHY